MSVVMNFAMFPTRKNESLSPYVAEMVKSIRSSGFESQLTSMGTIVETDTLSEALSIIDKAYASIEDNCDRVYVTVNIDIRKSEKGRIHSKIDSVEKKIYPDILRTE
ncbi:MAG: MTH1187 family thiamine-binding protein [Tenuifilaceae bacterium]|nr:MTH1187 family thiamine-binding protein [Tenuifilaceae bacterium]